MAELENARHERFAHAIASGKSPADSYTEAGFTGKNPAKLAYDLRKRPEVAGRISEISSGLREQSREITRTALAAAQYDATRVVMDVAATIQQSEEIARRCMQYEPILDAKGQQVMVPAPEGMVDRDGKPVLLAAAYTFDARGANSAIANKLKALHLIGIDAGRFVHRHEVRRSPLDMLPPELVRVLEQTLSIALEPQKPGLQVREPVTIEGEKSEPASSAQSPAGDAEGCAPGAASQDT